jgi:hypothetical protein
MRLADVIGIIKRMFKPPRISDESAAEIQNIFEQLSHITKLRESLVHRGMELDGDSLISSNSLTAVCGL